MEPVRLDRTVLVVPPVTHKILLGENCPIRAEEACSLPSRGTHVEHLAACISVRVYARVLLLRAGEGCVRYLCICGVVYPSHPGYGVHHHLPCCSCNRAITYGTVYAWAPTQHALQAQAHSFGGFLGQTIRETREWIRISLLSRIRESFIFKCQRLRLLT